MKIAGITAISFAPHVDLPQFELPGLQDAFETGIKAMQDLSFTIKAVNIRSLNEAMRKVGPPRLDVTIKTKRTPRKLKKAKKKAGTFYSKRTTHLHDMVMRKELECK